MNSDKKNFLGIELTKSIFLRFLTTMVIYTVVMIIAFLAFYYFFTSITWFKGQILYELLSPINDHKVGFIIFLWVVGFIWIFFHYWKKTLNYIDVIVQASDKLVDSSDELIHLPAELKNVEDKLNQIKQDAALNLRIAKEAELRKNDLVVYLAHDLKTPLTSVIGYLTLLRDEKKISDELRERYLSISLDRAERLEDLINEFFEITRFNLSHLNLSLSRVNLTRMLEQILFEFKPLFEAKNLEYVLNIEPNMEIKCDVDKMERVFDNMIKNAINYSFDTSRIIIDVEQYNEGTTIKFINRGNTIPKEKLDIIFEQFYRLDTSRATKTGGAGLGLAIAKQIITRHNGTISAVSKDEKVEFTIFLPSMP